MAKSALPATLWLSISMALSSSQVLEKTVMSTLAFTLAYSCLEQLSTRAGPGCRAGDS